MFVIPIQSLNKTIFVRLIIMFLVVILPIILLGAYLYYWSYNNASQEISRNTSIQLESYLENLNREIQWLEIQQFDILQDNELRKMALTWEILDSVEKKRSMNYIMQRLTSIKNTSAYMEDIYIHILSIDKTISAGSGVQDFNYDKYEYVLNGIQGNERRLIKKEETLNLSTSMMGRNNIEEAFVVVQIILDTEKLQSNLDTINVYPKSGSFLISEEMGLLLAAGRESPNIIQSYENAMNKSLQISDLLDVEGEKYHIDSAYSEELGLSVVTYLPEEEVSRPLTMFSNWALLFAVTSVIGLAIYAYSTYRMVHRPLLLLMEAFARMEKGRLDTPIKHEKKDEFGYLYDRYNKMLTRLRQLIDRDYKYKMMMQKAELKQLQSQINPHFLYNSFFILNSLAKVEDTERIELFTKMLGEYFRFITRNGEINVSLVDEIKHARTYTEIQNLRFSRRISIQFDELPKEMEQIKVPRLIVQPIIENAYEHSLEKKVDQGLLRVTFEMRNNFAYIIVEDNGNDLSDKDIDHLAQRIAKKDDGQEQTGIININRRIELTYGEESGIFLSRSSLNGLKVMVRIKLEKEISNV